MEHPDGGAAAWRVVGPWLTATAFLHSTMVQERRGSLKVWSLGLIIATFLLALFGTFEVRSGIISSVHSFAYSAIGPWFLGFLAVVIAGSIGLFIYRLPRLRPEHEFTTVFSREGSFLVNNLLLTGIAFATFWGTIFPILSQAVRNQTMTVGKAFYEQVNGPLFLLLLFTMGVGPLLAWRRASWHSIWRNFRGPALVAAACALVLPLLGVTSIWANAGFSVCLFVAVTICYELWRGVRVRHGHGESYPRAVRMLRPGGAGGWRHRLALLPDQDGCAAAPGRERTAGRLYPHVPGHHCVDTAIGRGRACALRRIPGHKRRRHDLTRAAHLPGLREPAGEHRLHHDRRPQRPVRVPGRI